MEKMVSIPFEDTSFNAYVSSTSDKKQPGLIVIHEVWGLKDHIKDVADRFAKEGYFVIAPDLLTETGITEKVDQSILKEVMNPATRDEAQKKLRAVMAPIHSPEFALQTVAKLQKCIDYLLANPNVNGKVGVVGFCFGGTYSYALTVADNRLKAAAPFYGHAPEPFDKLQAVSCPIHAFYGEQDQLMAQVPQVEEAMKKYGKNFEATTYPQARHAFFNDTNPTTYHKAAAKDAWQKVLEFLRINL